MAQRSDAQALILLQVGVAAAAVPCAILLALLTVALRLALDAAFDFGSPKAPYLIALIAPHAVLISVYFLLAVREPKLTTEQEHRRIDMHTPLTMLALFACIGAGLAASLFGATRALLLINSVLGEARFSINEAVPVVMLFVVLNMGGLILLPPVVFHRRPQAPGQAPSDP